MFSKKLNRVLNKIFETCIMIYGFIGINAVWGVICYSIYLTSSLKTTILIGITFPILEILGCISLRKM